MSDAPIDEGTPRPQHLILTIFGTFARSRGGDLAISELIALMAALDVEAGAVRSSVSRLKQRGVLLSAPQAGSAIYRLADSLDEVFRAGDRRIFGHLRAESDDPWLLASFSVPERERPLRHRLRTILGRLGFGQVTGGLWIAPGLIIDEARAALARADLTDYVSLFLGNHVSDEPLTHAVRKWWDFTALEAHYRAFIDANRPAIERSLDDRQAFAAYTSAITQWRRLPYMDPGIPADALPPGWIGLEAEALFAALREHLAQAAERFADAHVHAIR